MNKAFDTKHSQPSQEARNMNCGETVNTNSAKSADALAHPLKPIEQVMKSGEEVSAEEDLDKNQRAPVDLLHKYLCMSQTIWRRESFSRSSRRNCKKTKTRTTMTKKPLAAAPRQRLLMRKKLMNDGCVS
ncbi:glutamate-rich protein 2 isoform X2 [Synchiropus splendidus]|uniref:glutamate-rich protein 2 isoform X2 n=1 Tax=Synchiropus splendidus TaxID=270530 RepID=UPI00237E9876|nr:glutamate-rich protein 2 isoform X2 [Synchiropus splendidus]